MNFYNDFRPSKQVVSRKLFENIFFERYLLDFKFKTHNLKGNS